MALIHWLWGIGEKKVCAPERESFWRIVIFQEIFLVLTLALVVVKKGFLGHRNQFFLFPQNSTVPKIPLHPIPLFPQNHRNLDLAKTR